ncbi:MAG: hypothetical protein FJ296_03555 [Planctomycetes bacterium]|nr:hypothetical protein [Planctomycetota bacterium]
MIHLGLAKSRPNRHFAPVLASLATCLTILPAAHAGVLLVDPADPNGFAQIQPAVDAALSGDIVLVRPLADANARYEPFTVGGKTLAICGDDKLGVVRCASLVIGTVPAGDVVIVRELDLQAPEGLPAISVAAGDGAVRLEDLTATGGTNLASGPRPALVVSWSKSVVATYCRLTGGAAMPGGPFVMGAPALDMLGSEISVRGGTLAGGKGADNLAEAPLPGGRGGPGSISQGGKLFISNTMVLGGGGGLSGCVDPIGCDCGDSGGGGDAIAMTDTILNVEASTLVPGSGGPPICQGNGPTGLPIVASGGVVTEAPGPVHDYWMSSPVVTPEKTSYHFHGVMGEAVVLSASSTSAMFWLPKFNGYLYSGIPDLLNFYTLRILDTPSGIHNTTHPTPPPPPGIDSYIGYTQAFFVAPSGTTVHCGPLSTFLYIGYGP